MTRDPAFDDTPRLQAAREAWSRGATDAALSAFEEARATSPTNLRVRVEYARALGQLYEIVAADQLLDEAVRLAGGHRERIAAIAVHYVAVYRPEKAIELIEGIWRRGGATPPAVLGELARLYEKSGHAEAAEEAIREVVSAAPTEASPRILLGRLLRRRGNPADAIGLIESVAADGEIAGSVRAEAYAELCASRESLGEHAAAVREIEEAKALLRAEPRAQRLAAHSARVQQALDLLNERLDAATVDDWRDRRPALPPDAAGVGHLIGFPRSGTTLLEQVIAAHPGVFLSSERALFSGYLLPNAMGTTGAPPLSLESLTAISQEQLQQSRRRYLACSQAIEGARLDGRVHLDKNPNHTSIAAGLLRIFPESRFLFVVRDPRDVVVSAYLRHFPLSEVSVNFLTVERLAQLYGADMRNWRRFRERIPGQWLEIRYEELIRDLTRVAGAALELLGLRWEEAVLAYRDRLAGRTVNSPSHDSVRDPLYESSIGRWKNYEPMLEPARDLLDAWARELGYG